MDSTTTITNEEAGHQVQVDQAVMPGFKFRMITLPVLFPNNVSKEVMGKGECGRGEWKGMGVPWEMSPTGKMQKRMWKRDKAS